MKMKATGFGTVKTMLRSTGQRVHELSRKQMHRSSKRIVMRAQLYVPEDTTELRESIRIEKTYGDRGRLQIDVLVGDRTIQRENGKEIDLNQYALIIHERYSNMKPGKRTLEKMAANPGVHIGEGFLTRAVEEEEPRLLRSINDEIRQIISAETKKIKGRSRR